MIILWTILCLVEISGALEPSPCPDIFQYVKSEGSMRGKVIAPIENDYFEIQLEVKLSIGSRLRDSNFVGKLEPVERIWHEVCTAVRQGYLSYHVHFPQQMPIPVAQEISVNGKVICSGPRASASMITTITLTFKSTFENCPRIKKPEVILPPSPPPEFNAPVCGIVGALPTIVHGYESPRGAFPWYVALYQDNNFICGGSLVSKKHIITAAHCLKKPSTPGIYTVSLGKHDLSVKDELDSIQRNVLSITLHPDYKEHNVYLGDADIAFLTIEPVEFTNLIRPVCLFIQNVDETKFIGFKGAIAGWGVDENGQKRANEIKYTVIKVASTEDCKESHYEYRNINRSFCAGGENTGPCLGDSGGGMYFKIRRKWYLRGVVSTSIQDVLDNSGCDTSVYALYTDVLKFKDWLASFQ